MLYVASLVGHYLAKITGIYGPKLVHTNVRFNVLIIYAYVHTNVQINVLIIVCAYKCANYY